MSTLAQLIGMCMAIVFGMLTFPLYYDALQYDATCLSGVGLALHFALIGFVLSVVTLLVVIRRGARNL